MKKIIFIPFSLVCLNLFSQIQTFDILSFVPPKGWTKETQTGAISFSNINNSKKTWCRITIAKSTASNGNIETDFASEWNQLVKIPYKSADSTPSGEIHELKGWKVKAGVGKFVFNKTGAIAMLTSFSGFDRCASIVALTNSREYIPEIEKLLASVDLKIIDPADPKTVIEKSVQPSVAKKDTYVFNTTNFDDGWVSTVQENWVELTKGNIKVLLHYSNEVTAKYYPDIDEQMNTAWNNLVSPRYSNMQHYKTWVPVFGERSPYLQSANLTNKQTGKQVYVLLFKRRNSGWIEIIAPDKAAFTSYFKFDIEQLGSSVEPVFFNPVENLLAYNKFAVAAADLKGKWSDSFTASFFNYRFSDGQYMGMNTFASRSIFIFSAAGTYTWDGYMTNNAHSAGSGKQFKSQGSFKFINNWQVQFSDIQGKPKTYNVFFACYKGGRVLMMQDTGYGGYTGYGKVE